MRAGVQGPTPQVGLAVASNQCPSVGLALWGWGRLGIRRHAPTSTVALPVGPAPSCDIPLAYPGFYLTHRRAGFQFLLKITQSTLQTARDASSKPAGGQTPTVGRVGGGSPRSPFPSWELSCAGQSRTPTGAEEGGQRPDPTLRLPRHPKPHLQPPGRHHRPHKNPAFPGLVHSRRPPTMARDPASRRPGPPRPAPKDSLQPFHQQRLPHTRSPQQETHPDLLRHCTGSSAPQQRKPRPPLGSHWVSLHRVRGHGPIGAQRLGRAERPASSRLGSLETCACARPRGRRKRKSGARRLGAKEAAASGRTRVAMGRGSGTFERLLGNAAPARRQRRLGESAAPAPLRRSAARERSGAAAARPGH